MRYLRCLLTFILTSLTSLARNDHSNACWELTVKRPQEKAWFGYFPGTESDVFSFTTCPNKNSCWKERSNTGVILVNQNHGVVSNCFCSNASISSSLYGSHAGCPKQTVSNYTDEEYTSSRLTQRNRHIASSLPSIVNNNFSLNDTSSSIDDSVVQYRGKTRTPYPLLVVYSGPTTLSNEPNAKKRTDMYLDNFRYFLEQGLPCSHHLNAYSSKEGRAAVTVAIVLTNETLEVYKDILSTANAHCGGVEVIVRENQCYDLESVRMALTPHRIAMHRTFVFVNCGLMGPFLPYQLPDRQTEYWPLLFANALNDRVKMAGLTVNCKTKLTKRIGERLPHVQSFLWATDQKGLMAIFSAHAIFYCGSLLNKKRGRAELIEHYEVRMGRGIQEAGFDIRPVSAAQNFNVSLNFIRNASFPSWCQDIWGEENMKEVYGRLMTGPEAIFWKRSRFYPASVKEYAQRQRREYPSEDGFQAKSKYLTKKLNSQGSNVGISGFFSMLKLRIDQWSTKMKHLVTQTVLKIA